MSNSINIVYKNTIKLRPHEVDSSGLQLHIERSNNVVNRENCVSDEVDWRLRIAWWFLSGNVRFSKKGSTEISFGYSRSTHTWRDFKATLLLLKEFIRSPVQINFGITDDYDNHQQIIRYPINLQEGPK